MVISDYNLKYYEDENVACVYNVIATPTLLKHVQESQFLNRELHDMWNNIEHNEGVVYLFFFFFLGGRE